MFLANVYKRVYSVGRVHDWSYSRELGCTVKRAVAEVSSDRPFDRSVLYWQVTSR